VNPVFFFLNGVHIRGYRHL